MFYTTITLNDTNKYRHLSYGEREIIGHMYFVQKKNINQIATELKRHRSTILREIRRNNNVEGYSAEKAQKKYIERRNHKNFFLWQKYKTFSELFAEKYNCKWHGVELTRHYIKENYPCVLVPSTKQIYNWIQTNKWIKKRSDKLRTAYIKGRKRKKGMFSKFDEKYVFPIWMRPKHILNRKEFGHWELDLVIGKRQSGYSNLLVMVERKTRNSFITKVENKNPFTINSAIKSLVNKNNLHVKTITIDNGIEFSKIGIAAYWIKCKVYYCEPYASYQRGSNENVNGLIRRVYKKGTDFSLLSDAEINNLQNKINRMPRKMFNYMSSDQYYKKCMNSLNW
ncbi:transposase for IS1630-like insertion sequence element [Malacoplasma penetrans HF-2]|uniref:Transposase for IS1630-like insertion sequence element n=1 Tax=Malacoplasma penetrans (strain HF-2) TaxID=272633 RepID=Q8CM82_MALP2|nr:IS30 family transposase [Malacoplasma penetrans]BAC44324.1 transposase for IS1630-like insertion sequence element [Malacoplasma penetrans HF-2]BAC44329.1 transposase for IS1630-like insertion sequence element [Malacoplasma penetrans HF-2]BAC44356.1 transposase for IS1630-like insertion sequence element [Malacoplasma penetrans HF-2]